MKRLSLQWRITLMTALLICSTCVLMNCLVGYSGMRYMDSIGAEASAHSKVEAASPSSFDPTNKELDDALTIVVNDAQESFGATSWYITAAVTLLGGVLAYFVSGHALQPLRSFATQVESVRPDNLADTKISEDVPSELRRCSASFNDMIARLDEGFSAQRQFTGNAAHELRTPLALMQAQVELFCAEHPDVDLVIMDDGFQHRYVEPKVNIVMIDATRPVQHDRMLPLGTLRDLPEELHRAHYFVVTKCPEKMAPIDRRILRKVLIQVAYQRVYFTRFESFMPQPLFPDAAPGEPLVQGQQVIALSGIGSPKPFLAALRESYEVVAEMTLDDHHVYKVRDLNRLRELLDRFPGAVIVTTEKDAVKLTNRAKIPEEIQRGIYYLPINISFIEDSATDFLQKLEEDVRGN